MIDWLSLTLDLENYDNNLKPILAQLEDLKVEAIEIRNRNIKSLQHKSKEAESYNQSEGPSNKAIAKIGGELFEVKPTGTASYAYILQNDLMELRFAMARSRNENTYPIYVHFKSEFLWHSGPEYCWAWFSEWVTDNFAAITNNKINRVDLCCHTDKFLDLSPDLFKGHYIGDKVYRTNRILSGIEFGSRRTQTMHARIYNKSLEIRNSGKEWFRKIWNDHNLNCENVWNVEFEFNRNFFRSLSLDSGKKVETCEDLFNSLKPLWEYSTSGWLVMILDDSSRRERATIDPIWLEIQEAFSIFKGSGMVSRATQKDFKLENLIRTGFGYLTSYAALRGDFKANIAMQHMIIDGLRHLSSKQKSFKEAVEEKRSTMNLSLQRRVDKRWQGEVFHVEEYMTPFFESNKRLEQK